MDPDQLGHGDREESEGVVLAEVDLPGEGQAAQVGERADVIGGGDSGGTERVA